MIIAWLVLLAVLTVFFNDQQNQRFNPNTNPEARTTNEGVREVTLKRNRMGHYVANGFINGKPVVFFLDTGATNVAIPDDIANQLQLARGARSYVSTANGLTEAANTQLTSLSLGTIKLFDVRASIVSGFQSNTILLGMSALKQVEFTQIGDELTLRQY